MPTTMLNARDEMYDLLHAAWQAISFIPVPATQYGKRKPTVKLPPNDLPYMRVSIVGHDDNQRSLSNSAGKRKFTREGILMAMVYAPLGLDAPYQDSEALLMQLTAVVQGAFEGQTTPSAVWFRNITINNVGEVDGYEQSNVIVSFTFDEIK